MHDHETWRAAYAAGYAAGFADGQSPLSGFMTQPSDMSPKQRVVKRRQSGKQKLLSTMAGTAWTRYKRGNGKKTYIQIRAQVSRSAEYKRKAKKL